VTCELSKSGFYDFSRGVTEKTCPHDSLSVYFALYFKKKIKEERKKPDEDLWKDVLG
jgi:hypothetical protein